MYCKNCKYFEHNKKIQDGYCKHPNAITQTSLHTGINTYKKAIDMRKDGKNLCGHTGIYYLDKFSINPPDRDINVYCSTCKYMKLNDI